MKVAKILDQTRVVVTTEAYELHPGDVLIVNSEKITDPTSGESLGQLPTLRAKVTEVFPKFVVAETYPLIPTEPTKKSTGVSVGDSVIFYRGSEEL